MRIRSARRPDLAPLTALIIRSKSLWGYDEEVMVAFEKELSLTLDDLADSTVLVAEENGQLKGVVQVTTEGTQAVLDKLYISPTVIGRGTGRLLLDHVINLLCRAGTINLTVDADPNTEPFFRHLGADVTGYDALDKARKRIVMHMRFDLTKRPTA